MTTAAQESGTDLYGSDDVERYRDEWRGVQAGFVDDPEGAVRAADQLVERVLTELSSRLSESRDALQRGPDDGQRTERLRLAIRRYRTLFQQLTGTPTATGNGTTPAQPPTQSTEPVVDADTEARDERAERETEPDDA